MRERLQEEEVNLGAKVSERPGTDTETGRAGMRGLDYGDRCQEEGYWRQRNETGTTHGIRRYADGRAISDGLQEPPVHSHPKGSKC